MNAAAPSLQHARVWMKIPGRILLALRRARLAIFLMAGTYGIGLFAGVVMVHTGNSFALRYRDRIVLNAQKSSPILKQLHQGKPWRAAALDGAGNLLAASATALAGYWAPGPFPIALYRGWIGGIVSVDAKHRSRLRGLISGSYYLCVGLLQLSAYSILSGAGVNLGLARIKPAMVCAGRRFLGVPYYALGDAGWIFLFVIPLFALASVIEFLW